MILDMKKITAAIGMAVLLVVGSCSPAPEPVYAAEPVRKYEHVVVNRVIDGDTTEMTVDLGFGMSLNDKFRLYGIDTPEKKQVGNKEATEYLRGMIEGKPVTIEYMKQDKYGRRLANIFVVQDGKIVNVNQSMIQNGHAKSYFGGKKE